MRPPRRYERATAPDAVIQRRFAIYELIAIRTSPIAARYGPCERWGGTPSGDTPWIGPPWRLAAAALHAYHQPLGCSAPSSTPSQRPGDGRHRVPFA